MAKRLKDVIVDRTARELETDMCQGCDRKKHCSGCENHRLATAELMYFGDIDRAICPGYHSKKSPNR